MSCSALDLVSDYFGSQSAAAKALGVTPMAFTQWKRRGVPVKVAIKIDDATGGVVPKWKLRPDIFTPVEQGKAA